MKEVLSDYNRHVEHDWFRSDTHFDHIYPEDIQLLADRHWTPLRITKEVVDFLVPETGSRVLDIGSGVGKFCLAAAHYKPNANFCGVEQRKHLVRHAENARQLLQLKNVRFFSMNMLELDFKHFDHFYFYNSFYENLFNTQLIDGSVKSDPGLYSFYTRWLRRKLERMPAGTRLVTYHCLEGRPPAGYRLIDEREGTLLKCWMKV